jgi:hypothetical protein
VTSSWFSYPHWITMHGQPHIWCTSTLFPPGLIFSPVRFIWLAHLIPPITFGAEHKSRNCTSCIVLQLFTAFCQTQIILPPLFQNARIVVLLSVKTEYTRVAQHSGLWKALENMAMKFYQVSNYKFSKNPIR